MTIQELELLFTAGLDCTKSVTQVQPFGFIVGNGNHGYVLSVNETIEVYFHKVKEMHDFALRAGYDGYGIWKDGESVYIDPVLFIHNRDTALTLARNYGELAIYDYENKEVLYVDATLERSDEGAE